MKITQDDIDREKLSYAVTMAFYEGLDGFRRKDLETAIVAAKMPINDVINHCLRELTARVSRRVAAGCEIANAKAIYAYLIDKYTNV